MTTSIVSPVQEASVAAGRSPGCRASGFLRTCLATACGVGVASMVLVGCVERPAELSSAQREQLREFVSADAPHPQHELDISFGDRIQLIGYDVAPRSIRPGQRVTVTWYWHVVHSVDSGWRLFTHLVDADDRNRLNVDGDGQIRQLYQPGQWHDDEYITDRQEFTLPADWGSNRLKIYLGFWNGPNRLEVTNGPSDGENRALALDEPVAGGAAAHEVPAMNATFASAAPSIDGRLDEPAWANAASTSSFVNTMDGSPSDLGGTAKVAWDRDNLYIAFDLADTFLKATETGRDAHLWEQDCVEIMVDPDGDARNYFELQVSPVGTVFDTRYDTYRQPQPFGHVDWNSEIRAQVQARGTVNDESDDQGYTAEIAIPWSSFVTSEGQPMSAPRAGDTWRLNFYALDTLRHGSRASSWSPPMVGDFHVPARFGRITFVGDEDGETEASLQVVDSSGRLASLER